MSTDTPAEPQTPAPAAVELPFQAEVQQVLSLVINSLYTHQEVFLRELISNASDALDKARFLQLTRKDVTEQVGEGRISLKLDDDARTLTIDDNGIGMTREEVVQNLGTIARSGSLEFLKSHAEAARNKDAALQLIGQFGVGFYAAFMVAARVDVHTRSMLPGAEAVTWRSSGAGTFSVSPGDREHPGTTIVLHLKEDAREYAKAWRVKEIIRKYSDFVHFPIYVNDEQANRSRALWTMPKSQVTEEQHAELYRHVTGAGEEETPMLTIHWSVDAPVQFHALLYVPGKAPYDLFHKERKGLRLYAKRVLIMEDCDKLTPAWLRFLRGVVDSEDLSLNVSREVLQENKALGQIEAQIVKQTLKALKDLAESDADKYLAFYKEYGRVLKEGIAIDWKNQEAIADLCRFESMKGEGGKLTSLKEYVAAMPEAQKDIYFVTGPSRRAVAQSPHLEAFKKRGFDVLFLIDPVDEWVVKSLPTYDKKALRSVAHGDLDLGRSPRAGRRGGRRHLCRLRGEEGARRSREGRARLQAAHRQRQRAGRRRGRLRAPTSSASCAWSTRTPTPRPSASWSSTPPTPSSRTWPSSPPARRSRRRWSAWSELLLDQALLSEGVVQDPASLVKRIQDLLVQASDAALAQPSAPAAS